MYRVLCREEWSVFPLITTCTYVVFCTSGCGQQQRLHDDPSSDREHGDRRGGADGLVGVQLGAVGVQPGVCGGANPWAMDMQEAALEVQRVVRPDLASRREVLKLS